MWRSAIASTALLTCCTGAGTATGCTSDDVTLRAQGGVRSALGGIFIIYRDELSSFRRFSASCVRIWRPFLLYTKVKKSVFARPRRDSWDVARLVGTPRAHASATSISLRPHPYLLQGEQAALRMILAHFAARAASFFRQGSLPTPGVQLAKHAATIHAARSNRRGFSSALHDFHLNGCWPLSWEWLRSNWVAG